MVFQPRFSVDFYQSIFQGLNTIYGLKGGTSSFKTQLLKKISNNYSKLYKVDVINSSIDINKIEGIIINELKIAGAEAISINGKRIVNSTSINCAGNVIQINGEKVGSPFVINAIGDKDLLYGELTKNGGTLYKLKKYGVLTSIKKADSIEIDKEI